MIVQAPADFSLSVAPGSPTSQTIAAGQTAPFTLALAPSGSFNGSVTLSCAVTPAVSSGPTCVLSNSSVQLSGSASQTVTVNVRTTAPVTASVMPHIGVRPLAVTLVWGFALLGLACLLSRTRRQVPPFAQIILLTIVCTGCGGSGSTATHTQPGTPAGTYSVSVTGSSGSLSHRMALQLLVQ